MQTIKLTLAYDGTDYAGWQVQSGPVTVQGVVEKALAEITGQTIRATASGRTDAGVHALGQVVGFRADTHLLPEVWVRALNARLPSDVAVVEAAAAPEGFHAIRDAVDKRYRYTIHNGPCRDVFRRRYCWHYPSTLDVDAMARAAGCLRGRHDFASFQSSGAPRATTVRTVSDLLVTRGEEAGGPWLMIEIEADGFLYNMVRAIVGTLVEVGRGAQPESWVAEVIEARDRSAAGPTAPPQGLTLVRVRYKQ